MLLQKIKTKGFLGHLANESDGYVELDFGDVADKKLWLIHGENGAGKSSLWDAVTMAFFHQHRGGKINCENLIHNKADKAEVFVEFDLRGEKFQICVDIPKGKSVTRSLQFWNGETWEPKNVDVDVWVKEHLQISFDKFISSVLLQQGKADKFILEGATKRREIFLEVLQLKFYLDLRKSAEERKKESGKEWKKAKENLCEIDKPSAPDVKRQEKELEAAKKELKQLESDKEKKEGEFKNAEQAKDLNIKIDEIKSQQKQNEEIFERATQIRQEYKQFCELKDVLREIESVWRERKTIAEIETEIRENNLNIAEWTKKLAAKTKEFQAQKDEETKSKNKSEEFENSLRDLIGKQTGLKQQIEEIGKIENLEKRLEQEILELKNIDKILAETNQTVKKLEVEKEVKLIAKNELDTQFRKCETNLKVCSEVLKNRQQVIDKDKCPLCESDLSGEEIHEKIVRDFEEAKAEITELEAQQMELRKKLETAELEFSASEKKLRAETEKLQTAQIEEEKFKTRVENWQNQIGESSKFSLAERNEMRNKFVKCEDETKHLETEFDKSKKAFENLTETVRFLETEKIRLEADLRNGEQHQTNLQNKKENAEEKLTTAVNEISSEWRNHAAVFDENELQLLCRRKDKLQSSEAENTRLSKAETDQKVIESQLEMRQKDLEKIPQEHRREPLEVKAKVEEIKKQLAQKNEQAKKLESDLREMESKKEEYDKRKAALENVEKDYKLWIKLADALGKKGLETKIVGGAQRTISDSANQILQFLSNGNFQLELVGNEKMDILISDVLTGKQRAIEYFSGGEKFLTAVSLAVAIGQSASGQNIANTLIIDEGFGALDEKKRGLMATELKRLSEILQGARIIIVSHQDDVKENFANRFRLNKTNEGFINVQVNI